MATTRTVSIRNFREHMSKYLKEGQKNNVHFVVMRHAEPIAKVTPIEKDSSLESMVKEIAQARKDYADGKFYTTEEVLAMIDRRENHLLHSGRAAPRKTPTKHRPQNRAKDAVVRATRTSTIIRKKAH